MPTPWGSGAASQYIRTVPVASQIGIQAGAASFTDGFPPVTFLNVQQGGTPPWGQDANGIFNAVTAWLQWTQAGAPIPYDSVFQAEIGGYPNGAIVASASLVGVYWRSVVDNNASNPDTGGAGWLAGPGSVPTYDIGGTNNFPIPPTYRRCYVNNTIGAALTLLLPSAPVADETHDFKDITGSASFPILISGNGHNIDGTATVPLPPGGAFSLSFHDGQYRIW